MLSDLDVVYFYFSPNYCKDTEPSYHSFMYSPLSLLSGIYPLTAMHSLLATLYVMEYLDHDAPHIIKMNA